MLLHDSTLLYIKILPLKSNVSWSYSLVFSRNLSGHFACPPSRQTCGRSNYPSHPNKGDLIYTISSALLWVTVTLTRVHEEQKADNLNSMFILLLTGGLYIKRSQLRNAGMWDTFYSLTSVTGSGHVKCKRNSLAFETENVVGAWHFVNSSNILETVLQPVPQNF